MGILNVVMGWLVLGVLIFLIVNDREGMGLRRMREPDNRRVSSYAVVKR